jgi:hypothetical protein
MLQLIKRSPHVFLRSTSFVLIIVAILLLIVSLSYKAAILHTNIAEEIYPKEIMADINSKRVEAGLMPLFFDRSLTSAAEKKAVDMANVGYFSHTGPDGSTPWQYIESEGYNYLYAGENLAVDFFDVSELDSAWMNSPGHRANILNPDFQETGIGIANGVYQGREVVFYVQMFGSPVYDANAFGEDGSSAGKVLGASTGVSSYSNVNPGNAADVASKVAANPTFVLRYIYLFLTLIMLITVFAVIMRTENFRIVLQSVLYSLGTVIAIWAMFYIYEAISFVS